MKIAEISTFAQYSVGKITQEICAYTKKQGEDCKIFYFRGGLANDTIPSSKVGNSLLTDANAFLARILDNDGFCFFSSTKKLISELLKFNPDIIHLHCLHGYSFNVKKLFTFLLRYTKAAIIWTMHDAWAFTGHCCYFTMRKCNKWQFGCSYCPAKKDYPASYFFDKSKQNFMIKKKIFTSLEANRLTIVSPSVWLKNQISKSFLKKYETLVINNGINTNVYNDTQSSVIITKPKGKKMLLAVASVWDKRKGLERLLDLFINLQSDEWYLVIVGKLEKKLPQIPGVVHIERTNNIDELKAYYQAADIFINPTLDENFPTVNLEAQACGCKVISSSVGGSLETQRGNLYEMNDNEFGNQLHNVFLAEKKAIDNNELSSVNMAKKYYELFCKSMEKD